MQALASEDPVKGLAVPGGQAVQADAAGAGAKNPAAHAAQAAGDVARREGWYEPACVVRSLGGRCV